jgi:regulator of protease activity HflC (stomatin/prohibitin superfamily)
MPAPATVALLLFALFVLVGVLRSVRIVPQQMAVIIERLGSYSRTLDDGLHLLVPFVDRVRDTIDLREQVVTFPPQPVITSDNLVVSIDTVIYYTVTDAKSAVYEIANFIQGIEQLTVTTLRNVIGSLDLEETLTSRDQINGQLRGVLDQETGRWGIRVNRVELKAIDPPHSVQDSMEKQMRAERDKRAAILTAEGVKQAAILSAEGERQAQILRAEGSAQARVLEAQGQAKAIQEVFEAIHEGGPTHDLLAYQYLQVLPQLARGDSNKMWIVPSELTDALRGISQALGGQLPAPSSASRPPRRAVEAEVESPTGAPPRPSADSGPTAATGPSPVLPPAQPTPPIAAQRHQSPAAGTPFLSAPPAGAGSQGPATAPGEPQGPPAS